MELKFQKEKSNNNNVLKSNDFKNKPNLKYKLDITNENDGSGCNDLFEVYISFKDNKEYIASKNINHNIDIFLLLYNIKIKSLKGHESSIRTIRYFINNKNCNEYLISADSKKIVIIWDINNEYKIKHKIIDNNSYGLIWSCLLIFPYNIKDNYIIISNDNEEELTKIYSFDNATFIKYIKNNHGYYICYLLSWYNKKDNNYYIIQLAKERILINNLLENILFFIHKNNSNYFTYYVSGFIFNKDNKDFLCCSISDGYIEIFDLSIKVLINRINISSEKNWLQHIIRWNQRYIIVADIYQKCFKIVDLQINKVISKIKHTKGVSCIKKIYHPIYGESLLSASKDGFIKLWVYN